MRVTESVCVVYGCVYAWMSVYLEMSFDSKIKVPAGSIVIYLIAYV